MHIWIHIYKLKFRFSNILWKP